MEAQLIATMQTMLTAFTLAMVKPFHRTFDGTGPSAKFLNELESYFLENNVPEGRKLTMAAGALKGQAKTWYDSVKTTLHIVDYLSFKNQFVKVFPKVKNQVAIESDIYSKSQMRGEATLSFVLRKVRLAQQYLNNVTEAQIIIYLDIIDIIKTRLLPQVQDFLDSREIDTLADLIEYVGLYDNRHPPYQKQWDQNYPPMRFQRNYPPLTKLG